MQMTQAQRIESLHSLIWDMYKDAYGIRPRHMPFETMTVEQLESEVDSLEKECIRQNAIRLEDETRNAVDFEKRVADTISMGARDRATAIRWIHTAEDTDGDNRFLEYTLGLAYNYIKE